VLLQESLLQISRKTPSCSAVSSWSFGAGKDRTTEKSKTGSEQIAQITMDLANKNRSSNYEQTCVITLRCSLAGQDIRLSPERPGFESRQRKLSFIFFCAFLILFFFLESNKSRSRQGITSRCFSLARIFY
jgi:hypothetical protein